MPLRLRLPLVQQSPRLPSQLHTARGAAARRGLLDRIRQPVCRRRRAGWDEAKRSAVEEVSGWRRGHLHGAAPGRTKADRGITDFCSARGEQLAFHMHSLNDRDDFACEP